MRNTSITNTFANAIVRFTNAGIEMVRASLLVEPIYQPVQPTRLLQCAGYRTNIPSGNSRAANQGRFWNLTAKPKWTLLSNCIGEISAISTMTDAKLWHTSDLTRCQARLGKS